MNRILWIIFTIFSFFSAATFAEKNCDNEMFKTARNDFKKLYDQKKYSEAVKILKTATDKCYELNDDNKDQYCWVQSDLALGLLKSGDAQACRNQLASQVVPNVTCPCCGASIDDGKEASSAEKAALHNYELCEAALKQELTKFKTTACPLKLPARALSSSLIPADQSSKGATECLVLIGSTYGKDFSLSEDPKLEAKFESSPQLFCSQLMRLTRKSEASKTVQSKTLSVGSDDPIMGDSTYCCKLDQLGVLNENGQLQVYISSSLGPSQPCGSIGTMRASAEGIYQIKKDKLTLKKNLSWGTH